MIVCHIVTLFRFVCANTPSFRVCGGVVECALDRH